MGYIMYQVFICIIRVNLYNVYLYKVFYIFKSVVKMWVCLYKVFISFFKQTVGGVDGGIWDRLFFYRVMDKYLEYNVIKVDLFCFSLFSYLQS